MKTFITGILLIMLFSFFIGADDITDVDILSEANETETRVVLKVEQPDIEDTTSVTYEYTTLEKLQDELTNLEKTYLEEKAELEARIAAVETEETRLGR